MEHYQLHNQRTRELLLEVYTTSGPERAYLEAAKILTTEFPIQVTHRAKTGKVTYIGTLILNDNPALGLIV